MWGAKGAIPFIKYMGMAYGAQTVPPMAHPMMMWVDDTITVLTRGRGPTNTRGPRRPARLCCGSQRVLWVSVPDKNVQHGSTWDPWPL